MAARFFRFFPFAVGALALLVLMLAPDIQAAPTNSVTLTYFRGESTGDSAQLAWQTATELDTAGFRILRAASSGGPFNLLEEIGVVPAQGGATSGANYEAEDTTAERGQTYWYQLVEIELNGSEQVLETVSVVIGETPTATVEGIGPSDDGDSGEATASTPSATPQPSPTGSQGAATNTPRPTATQAAQEGGATGAAPAPAATPTTVRAVGGGGIAQAASTTESNDAPLIVAQATDPYPGATATEAVPDDPYPGAEPSATVMIIDATVESYPGGVAPPITTQATPDSFGNTVGASGGSAPASETEGAQSAPFSRVLLWIGFSAALLIFIAGAVFAIVLSTRKQRREL